MCLSGLLNHRDDIEDEMDGHSPPIILDMAWREQEALSDGYISTASVATDEEAVAAEYLRVIGDRLQAEYGNQLDSLMNGLDWTLARDALLADVRRVLADLLRHISDVWTQASRHFTRFLTLNGLQYLVVVVPPGPVNVSETGQTNSARCTASLDLCHIAGCCHLANLCHDFIINIEQVNYSYYCCYFLFIVINYNRNKLHAVYVKLYKPKL